MKRRILPAAAALSVALLLALAACMPPARQQEAARSDGKASPAACPDDGPRLPGTGLCRGRAVNYFDPARLSAASSDLPEGCSYVVNETLTPDPNEAFLYNALSCNGKTTSLEFSAGAHSATLGYGVSGFFENTPTQGEDGSQIVRIFPLEGVADPGAMVLDIVKGAAREANVTGAEIAACALRPAGERYPADALVADVNDAYRKAHRLGRYDGAKDGPGAGVYAACGPYGFTDAQAFWMIRDGYAWFVDQGQDVADFDAGSLTVFRKGADGTWGPAR